MRVLGSRFCKYVDTSALWADTGFFAFGFACCRVSSSGVWLSGLEGTEGIYGLHWVSNSECLILMESGDDHNDYF